MAETNGDQQRIRRSRRNELISFGSGTFVAFGLSTCAVVVGALLAVVLEAIEVLPDGWWPLGWVLLAALGTVGAGFTVRDVAGAMTRWSIALAGIIVFVAATEVSDAIESTGNSEPSLVVPVVASVMFVVLLVIGARITPRAQRSETLALESPA